MVTLPQGAASWLQIASEEMKSGSPSGPFSHTNYGATMSLGEDECHILKECYYRSRSPGGSFDCWYFSISMLSEMIEIDEGFFLVTEKLLIQLLIKHMRFFCHRTMKKKLHDDFWFVATG